MFNSQKFDEIAKRLSEMVPERLKGMSDDLQKNFRSVLQGSFSKMDLVSREEFDAQTKVLAKTRAKLDEMEQKIAALEVHLLGSAPVVVTTKPVKAKKAKVKEPKIQD